MRKFVSRPLLLLTAAIILLSSCNAGQIDSTVASGTRQAPATPVITWAQPAPVAFPAPLTATQLDATASVPGTFAYTPAEGTVLPVGTQTLSTVFTPTDTANYNIASVSVAIVVNAAPISPAPANPTEYIAVADSGDDRILIYGAPLSANQNASIVIGQAGFTQGMLNQGDPTPSAATLAEPGLSLDSAGDLWVPDFGNCRVLEFQPPFTAGMSASLVIGEPNFDTTAPQVPGFAICIPSASVLPDSLEGPASIAFDSHGDLWVADQTADRVLEYVPPFSNGMAASIAIGQMSLVSAGPCNGLEFFNDGPLPPATPATLCEPGAIVFDSNGDLWVSDEGNLRILEFVPPFSTGMSASLAMVGQPPSAFNGNGVSCNDTSASSFCYLVAIAFDGNGDLWVADGTFGRVLGFVPPFGNGMAASLVLGQPDFTETGNSVYNTTGSPGGLFFDSSGNLIISGTLVVSGIPRGRIVVYAPPFGNGMEPSAVMSGQQCPPAAGDVVSANTLCDPGGIVAF